MFYQSITSFNFTTREPMHNLLPYLQFNPSSAITMPGFHLKTFHEQHNLASLPIESASNQNTNEMSFPGYQDK